VIGTDYAGELKRDICARNTEFAKLKCLAHVPSYGAMPVTVYAPEAEGRQHGNFYPASYRAILKRENWSARLNKVHSQARTALPRAERRWRELDSCTSSDALLMNIFCCPGVCSNGSVAAMLGTEKSDEPRFGVRASVPLQARATSSCPVDRTEVDMKLGSLLVEAKLTENNFQIAPPRLVENYRDLKQVFDVKALPRSGERYISYQLIRNVLAAHAADASFCVMLDVRRPDLVEAWYTIMSCVRDSGLRTRCKVLTWQELSRALAPGVR
jgi:hypothetical protein